MFNILNTIRKIFNKNHLTMILVLLTLLLIMPSNTFAKMSDYSKFDWDKYYESNKFMFGELCLEEDANEDGSCKEDSLLMGQKKFFVRMYKILAKYQKKGLVISDYLVITTALIGLAGEQTGNREGDEKYKDYYYNKKEGELQAGLIYDESIDDDNYDIEEKYDEEEANKMSLETDTVVVLIKNSIAYYTYCYGIYGDPEKVVKDDGTSVLTCPDGGTVTTLISHPLGVKKEVKKCAVNISASTSANGYELGFWTYYSSKMNHDSILSTAFKLFGLDMKDEYYDECEEKAQEYPEGTHYQYVDKDNKVDKHISNNKYFDYLKENPYFDKKPHLQGYFSDVLEEAGVKCMTSNICDESLEAAGRYEEFEEKIQADRVDIIHDIIDTLNQNGIPMSYEGYGTQEYDDATYNTNDRSLFYWPIGSEEITERQVGSSTGSTSGTTTGKRMITLSDSIGDVFDNSTSYKLYEDVNTTTLLFADGDPKYTTDNVDSYFGERTSPIDGNKEEHYGIDITADIGTPIIAVFDGTVNLIKSGCTSGDYECNDGYGNYIIVSHSNGDYTLYGHLSEISEQISEGRTVFKGQVIGKSGDTGETKKPNFYYELRMGGNSVSSAEDPIANTSAGRNTPPKKEDLRPVGGSSIGGVGGRSTKFDGTHLTESEFVGRVSSYCQAHPGQIAAAMCNSPSTVYEASRNANVNPELVITRAMAEGNSPGDSKHNYWGMGCTNTGGYAACITYSSLEDGIRGFAGTVTKYDNLMSMQLKYAYIGRNWYNPGSWPTGGCIYFPYIKQYMSPQRQDEVTAICAKPSQCNTGGGDCTPTIQEDQNAYATWQVEKKLGPYMRNVFGT